MNGCYGAIIRNEGMHMRDIVKVLMTGIAAVALAPSAANASYTFTVLDDPAATSPGNEGYGTYARSVNDSGTVVGNSNLMPDPRGVLPFGLQQGFVYSGPTFTTVNDPNGVVNYLFGINDSGDVVGRYSKYYQNGVPNDQLYNQSFLYNIATNSFTPLTKVSGSYYTAVNGISNNGRLTGEYSTADDLGTAGQAFVRDAAGNDTLIAIAGASTASAAAVNNSGDVVGAYTDGNGVQHGFLYDAAGNVTNIDMLGAASTAALGINDAGQVVGTYTDTAGVNHGFLLAGGTFTTVDDTQATSTTISGINNNGMLTGTITDGATNSVGKPYTHGFLATPTDSTVLTPIDVPEPATLALLGAGLFGLTMRRRLG